MHKSSGMGWALALALVVSGPSIAQERGVRVPAVVREAQAVLVLAYPELRDQPIAWTLATKEEGVVVAARPAVSPLLAADEGAALVAAQPPRALTRTDFGRVTVAGNFTNAQTRTVTVATPQVVMTIDTPGTGWWLHQPFHIGGWAIDLAMPVGAPTAPTGISAVYLYAVPNGGTGTPIPLGYATPGPRPDIAAAYGPQFLNSGYGYTVSGLAPGSYEFRVYALSAVHPQWVLQSVWT